MFFNDLCGSISSWSTNLIYLILFLFPVGVANIDGWSTVSYVLLIIYALYMAIKRIYRFEFKSLSIIYMGLLFHFFTVLLSFINADDVSYGISRFGKFLPLYAMVFLIPFFKYLGGNCFVKIWRGIVLSGPVFLAVALHALWFRGLSRAQGYYHPIIFGDLSMLMGLIMLAALVCGVIKIEKRRLVGACMLCSFLASILSQTRGAWFALPCVLLLLAYLYRNRLSLKLVLISSLMVLLFCSTLPVLFPQSIGKQIVRTYDSVGRYLDGTRTNTSIGSRFMMWGIAIEVFKKHPLIGTGLGDFKLEAQKAIDDGRTKLSKAYTHSHSVYMESLATTGILGFMATLLGIFILPFKVFYQDFHSRRDEEVFQKFISLTGMVMISAFFAFGLSEAWLVRSTTINAYALFLAVVLSMSGSSCLENHSKFL